MNVQNVKKQAAKTLADISLKLGTISADSVCCYIFPSAQNAERTEKNEKG